ncbi:tigger transposable element-derived protein 4-like [Bacillus rossius redtenbacheri]|uniref:tigger transposable element-derived protein 4-like n=1 Tax=Bacillus rossius redtenbacheri TaxID=93214 RepID=UPI002FDCB4F3
MQESSQFPVQVQQPVQARPTDSWLQKFAVKHSIIISDATGQTFVPVTSFTHNPDWLSTMWLATRKDYLDQDIFHVDETGLFFRLTPEKTMTCLGEHCFGGKLAGERVTVVLGTNLTGSEKRHLLVVGKCSDPQLLASIEGWPLKYASNNKSWMTNEIFESELRDWDSELQLKNRRILLLVGDCSAHPRVSNLKNIRLVYLPYHVASVRQPMGRGIFRSFKTQYRRLLILQLIDCFEKNAATSITLIDALRMLYKAWLRVPVEMIKNCFLQTGLMKSGSEGSVFEEFEDDIPLSLWLSNHSFTQFDAWKETIDWYVEADSELQTSEEPEEKDMKIEEPAAEG